MYLIEETQCKAKELRSRDLVNDSDWYVWRFYVDTVATQVGKLRTLIKDTSLTSKALLFAKEN